MPDDNTTNLGDQSILLEADTLAQRAVEAQKTASEMRGRGSITSPQATNKNVPVEDAEDAMAKHFEEATGTKPTDDAPAEAPPAPGVVSKAPGVPDDPSKPKGPTPAEAEAERRKAESDAAADGSNTLDNLLANARTEPEIKPEVKPETVPDKSFEEHNLPSTASEKSKETFRELKRVAGERVTAEKTRADAAELRAQAAEKALAEAQAKAGTLTPEVEAELKELREHRALFATEQDPAFRQKYDARLEKNYEVIYTHLRAHQLPETEITVLKGLPRAERDANIDRYIGLISDPADKRPLEAKMLQNAAIVEERENELQQVKGRAQEIVKTQLEAPKVTAKARQDEVANLVRPNLAGLTWFNVRDIPANTPPELKKSLEASNAFATEMREQLRNAIIDDSPAARAVAALAVPLSYYYAREARIAKAALQAANEKLDRITKASSTSRLGERASVRSDTPKKVDANADPRDTLDALFTEAGGKLE